jgi:hypothetical protein
MVWMTLPAIDTPRRSGGRVLVRRPGRTKESYRACPKLFGSDPWTDREPVREFTEDELVAWIVEGVEVL